MFVRHKIFLSSHSLILRVLFTIIASTDRHGRERKEDGQYTNLQNPDYHISGLYFISLFFIFKILSFLEFAFLRSIYTVAFVRRDSVYMDWNKLAVKSLYISHIV